MGHLLSARTPALEEPIRVSMADQTLARYVNELGVLTLLRTQGPASRADLARKLSLTPATITRLVSELLARKLVEELRAGGAASDVSREIGRPGVSLRLRASGAYFLGVEIGVGIVRIALLDLSASEAFSATYAVSDQISPDEAVDLIASELKKLQRNPHFKGRIRSMGVTVPGLVQLDGFIVHLPMLGWKEISFTQLLSKKIALPCVVENNANAAAFGSIYTQPALPSICTIFLKIGSGCGGAAIVNGRLLRGAAGTAGELGHIRLTEHGHRCSCGQKGCLESWVNLAALARAWGSGKGAAGKDLFTLPTRIVAAAKAGEGLAIDAISSLVDHLILGVVSLVNIFNPTTVMLGGAMKPVLEWRLGHIRKGVVAGIVPGTLVPNVLLSPLGDFECAIGAACLAHHRAFDISNVDLAENDSRS
jgi:predicted NBD/HSP70 family sugar kinase